MFGPGSAVCISLGSVVLDRPDQTGTYIAKDLAGGWAYLVADEQGDHRCRGQGVCDGGLDVALRCAFLSASHRVSDSESLGIVVESRQAHRAMAWLAVADPLVVAAIAGRPVAIMTRPEARATLHVRLAAERAAAAALREREHAERHIPVRTPTDSGSDAIAAAPPPAAAEWRQRRTTAARALLADRAASVRTQPGASARTAPILALQRMLMPHPASPRNRPLTDWLTDFDARMASVNADLQGVGV